MDLAGDDLSRVQRACDSCRSRKIRCDRGSPCSNCRASKLTCQTTAPAQKTQRQRVHISDEYERKIDRIEDRLAGIESVLEKLATKLTNLDIHTDQSTNSRSSKTGRSPHSTSDVNTGGTPAPFEGDTAMNIQSEFARELLEKAVGSTPSIGQNAEIKAALTMLQDMVSKQSALKSTSNDPQSFLPRELSNIDASKLERPPWSVVKQVLDDNDVFPAMCFSIIFPFLKPRKLYHAFEQVYDVPEESSSVRRVLVYGVLYNLFTEFNYYRIPGRNSTNYVQYSLQCKIQLQTAISQLELLMAPSYENIMALLLATSHAVEMCKPSLCWLVNSTAIVQAQSLGYHRISTMKDDSPEERASKVNTFWFLYMMDKTLSLRLGRAAAIQDWDISLPFLDPSNLETGEPSSRPSGFNQQVYWAKVAQIQGRLYEQLFSPASFLKPVQERAHIANELVLAMNQAWAERGDASVLEFVFQGTALQFTKRLASSSERVASSLESDPYYSAQTPIETGRDPTPAAAAKGIVESFGNIFHYSDIVVHYSTLTLIQRASSADNVTFNSDCLESARKSLKAHMKCSRQFNVKGNEEMWSGYVHWSLLQAPFTPFIVLFCNTIKHCNEQDLITLSDFVISLESVRATSEGAERLYKVCHLFLLVSKHYLEAKKQEAEAQRNTGTGTGTVGQDGFYTPNTQDNINQFDPYLSALGLLPNVQWPTGSYAPMPTDAFQVFDPNSVLQQNTVQEWFSGSRYIMGLMEDDVTMPDLNL